MKILDNLLGYNEKLDKIKIDGIDYRTRKDFAPSAIIAQSFGETFDEDSYNYKLAKSVIASQEYFGEIPKILQSQISHCYEELKEIDYFSVGEMLSKDNYLDTENIFKEALQIIEENKFNKENVLFVAHPAHSYRVIKTAEKYGLRGEPFIKDAVEWPKNDNQWWVKNPIAWVLREIPARSVINSRFLISLLIRK